MLVASIPTVMQIYPLSTAITKLIKHMRATLSFPGEYMQQIFLYKPWKKVYHIKHRPVDQYQQHKTKVASNTYAGQSISQQRKVICEWVWVTQNRQTMNKLKTKHDSFVIEKLIVRSLKERLMNCGSVVWNLRSCSASSNKTLGKFAHFSAVGRFTVKKRDALLHFNLHSLHFSDLLKKNRKLPLTCTLLCGNSLD